MEKLITAILLCAVLLWGCVSAGPGERLEFPVPAIDYSQVSVEEMPPMDEEADYQHVFVDFYYHRVPKRLALKKHIIPGKFQAADEDSVSGTAEFAASAEEAERQATEVLWQAMIRKAAGRFSFQGRSPLVEMEIEGLVPGLLEVFKARQPGYLARFKRSSWTEYAAEVPAQLEEPYLSYLLALDKLDPRYFSRYFNHAILVRLADEEWSELYRRMENILAGGNGDDPAAKREIIEQARFSTKILERQADRELIRRFDRNRGEWLGKGVPASFFDLSVSEKLARTRLEVIREDPAAPAIRLLASVFHGERWHPAAGAFILANARKFFKADPQGIVDLTRAFLKADCLRDGKLHVQARFKYFHDLERTIRNRENYNRALVDALGRHRFSFTRKYTGKASLRAENARITKKMKGLIFKDLAALELAFTLRESNQVPVVLERVQVAFSFYNQSRRRAVDEHAWSGKPWERFSGSRSFSLELKDRELLDKVESYQGFSARIELLGRDDNRNPFSLKTDAVIEEK